MISSGVVVEGGCQTPNVRKHAWIVHIFARPSIFTRGGLGYVVRMTTTMAAYQPLAIANDVFNDPVGLNRLLDEDGYLYFRGMAPKEKVLRARRDILKLCRDVGWARANGSSLDAIWTGVGPFGEGDPEYMPVYKKMLNIPSFLGLPEDEGLMKLMERILGGEVLLHRRKMGRVTFPNNTAQTTPAHQDFQYIRGTPRTFTLWMPIGECPLELGGLAVLKGSHRAGFIEHQLNKVRI